MFHDRISGVTSPASAAMLNGMPHPADLRVRHHDGQTFVIAGQMIIACYPDGDVAMRNVAVAVARQLGFSGQQVAQQMGLTASYVATLHQRARREGAAGLVRPSGPKPKLSPRAWARAARSGGPPGPARRRSPPGWAWPRPPSTGTWPAPGQQELPRRRGRRSAEQQPLAARPWRGARAGTTEKPGNLSRSPRRSRSQVQLPAPGLVPAQPAGLLVAGSRITGGQVPSRYAGAMVLHAFGARAGAGESLAAAGDGGPGGRQFADVALLSAVSTCFALGAATIEQVKHLTAAAAGPLAGLTGAAGPAHPAAPAGWASPMRTDPLELQAMFAQAMLAADPVTSGVYYVDDHFVPYAGAKPVGKGWNNKRGKAEKRPGGHARHRPRRAGGVLRHRRAVRPGRHAAQGAGRAEAGRAARGRGDHARVRPRRRLPRRCSGTAARKTCTGSPTGGRR